MTAFDEARSQVRQARTARTELDDRLRRAEAARSRLARRMERLRRGANDGSGASQASEIARLQTELENLAQNVDRLLADRDRLNERRIDIDGRFEPFTDPTEAIENLSDRHPFLLLPLRLETRFGTAADGTRQLWVRAFPDDILVDTFDPVLAEAEVANTRLYWINVWRAGGDEALLRAAWSSLARSHGSGRARWLLDEYAPLNSGDEPVAGEGDHVLVIAPTTPVPVAEQASIAAYWAAVWQTSVEDEAAARADLDAALGSTRADEVVTTIVPVNYFDPAVTRADDTGVIVAYLDLPPIDDVAPKELVWSRAARTWLLPERLVLMGFRGDVQELTVVGNRIPDELQVGPGPSDIDPSAPPDPDDPSIVPEGMAWTVDFDEAVRVGMGFQVELTDTQADAGFDRLFMVGVRLGSDAAEGGHEIEELISNHQRSRKGFSLLPQGRPTNNTDRASAGYSWWEDPDEAYDHYFVLDGGDDPDDWRHRTDGRWLSELLGIERHVLQGSPHYFGTDQSEARAMNTALWPATLGYFLEQMMAPLEDEATTSRTRDFFNRFVVGTGLAPAVRVGRQPYGILPTTAFSRARWLDGRLGRDWNDIEQLMLAHLSKLNGVVESAVAQWADLVPDVAAVGTPSPDPQQRLLDIIGLHPRSVEHYQRYAETFDELYNRLTYSIFSLHADAFEVANEYVESGLQLLTDLGIDLDIERYPTILDKFFLLSANLLTGNLVAPKPMSESSPLAARRSDGDNYLQWLVAAARTSHDALRRQDGFDDGVLPTELLYLMLHHALDLNYVDTGFNLLADADVLDDAQLVAARQEALFVQVAQPAKTAAVERAATSVVNNSGSRWHYLYQPFTEVTGDPTVSLGTYIGLNALNLRSEFTEQVAAIEQLADAPTAALERAFVAHLDCCSYRLDAWRSGLVGAQLDVMRNGRFTFFENPFFDDDGGDDSNPESDAERRQGVLVGAYGWLENVRPKPKPTAPIELDPELAEIFDENGGLPLVSDSTNMGHIHAPSLNHAVAAAVLRNGYMANATPDEPESLAVNITSARVRDALRIIAGIRHGQSLGALLGYRLERSLHDSEDLFLDRLIFELRGIFPLAGRRLASTASDAAGKPISAVEARNVVDGLALVEHLQTDGVSSTYPYDLDGLPTLDDLADGFPITTTELAAAIDNRVDDLLALNDSVADLAIAEGVFQVVAGNYDRAAGTLEAFSKGTHPPTPDVARTPRTGAALTHRIALHLQAGLDPSDPANTTVRAQGEPSLNAWLTGVLPPPAAVSVAAITTDPDGMESTHPFTLDELGLLPIDVLFMLGVANNDGYGSLDGLIIHHARRSVAGLRPDTPIRPEYHATGGSLPLFTVAPLIRSVRGLALGSRALRTSDLVMANEAGAATDARPVARPDKVVVARATIDTAAGSLRTLTSVLGAAVGEGVDDVTATANALVDIDRWITDHDNAMHELRLTGLPGVDLTVARDRAGVLYGSLVATVDDVSLRWTDKLQRFDALMDDYQALPADATDDERFSLLIRAGQAVSSGVIAPLPPTPADMESTVQGLRGDLVAAQADLEALPTAFPNPGSLHQALDAFASTAAAFDHQPIDLGRHPGAFLALARRLLASSAATVGDIQARLVAVDAMLDELDSTELDEHAEVVAGAGRTLLGEAFVVLPEFTLSADQLAEWDNAWSQRDAMLAHLDEGPDTPTFPVDDWLHGLARVRPKPGHIEHSVLLGETLGTTETVDLIPLQFPYSVDAAWLGARFPDTMPDGVTPFRVDGDHLLYTVHIAPGADVDPSNPTATHCGILVDEWLEVVPGRKETSGLTFHFDRPSSEPPQALLLVTPPDFTGAWQWDDLVAALHDTLDFARVRAVDPDLVDTTPFARYLPALLSSVTLHPITSSLNYSFNNGLALQLERAFDE